LTWGALGYDSRSFYITGYDYAADRVSDTQQAYRRTGVSAFASYPLSRHYRFETSIGYESRAADYPTQTIDPSDPQDIEFVHASDSVPLASVGMVGDTTKYNYYGPHQGSRWRIRYLYGFDTDEGGSRFNDLVIEWRKYLAISRRQEFALRFYGVMSDGNRPNIYAIGGYDTLRGYRTWSIPGNRIAVVNAEWRFPLFDRLDLAFMPLGQVRGRVFADVGAAWFRTNGQEFNYLGQPGFQFYGEKTLPDGTVVCQDGALCDGLAAYGFGITVNLFGLPFNWDWVQRWDFSDSLGGTELYWWVGMRF
jgi:outer membrane protein assembly factor BamA